VRLESGSISLAYYLKYFKNPLLAPTTSISKACKNKYKLLLTFYHGPIRNIFPTSIYSFSQHCRTAKWMY